MQLSFTRSSNTWGCSCRIPNPARLAGIRADQGRPRGNVGTHPITTKHTPRRCRHYPPTRVWISRYPYPIILFLIYVSFQVLSHLIILRAFFLLAPCHYRYIRIPYLPQCRLLTAHHQYEGRWTQLSKFPRWATRATVEIQPFFQAPRRLFRMFTKSKFNFRRERPETRCFSRKPEHRE